MRVILTILVFVFLTISSIGQEYGLQTKLIDENHTWRTVSSEQLDSFYFNLQPIQTTKYKSHIRISLTGQLIDFYSSGKETYFGRLTNFTTEYKTVKDKENDYVQRKAYKYFFEQVNLEQGLVDKMVKKLLTSGQPEIPTDTLIASWQRTFVDCNSLIFQFNYNGKYAKQSFHCPWGQNDSIKFKNVVLDNYQSLKSTFQLDSLYKLFENKLPKGKSYSSDGYRMIYKMTDQQSVNWVKTQPKRDFMKSVKDTLDSYINSELKKQKVELNEIDCYQDYSLTFGTNGKLKKVAISKQDKPKLKNSLGLGDYLADKKEIRKCKSKIRQIFSEIDLSFLNLEYEIYRTFSFDYNREFQLRDDTIY